MLPAVPGATGTLPQPNQVSMARLMGVGKKCRRDLAPAAEFEAFVDFAICMGSIL